ncbi:MAG: hypothetical protein AB1631_07630 [Acidobacteriota bacterium]
MIQIREDNLAIWHSENIPYTRVDLSGFLTAQQFQERLSNPKLWGLVAEKAVANILINGSELHRFGTEDIDWITTGFLQNAAAAGIRKVSVVVAGNVYDLLANIFDSCAASASNERIAIRFFYDSQFYDGWEAVSWFD